MVVVGSGDPEPSKERIEVGAGEVDAGTSS